MKKFMLKYIFFSINMNRVKKFNSKRKFGGNQYTKTRQVKCNLHTDME
jgi:hypothetical protein